MTNYKIKNYIPPRSAMPGRINRPTIIRKRQNKINAISILTKKPPNKPIFKQKYQPPANKTRTTIQSPQKQLTIYKPTIVSNLRSPKRVKLIRNNVLIPKTNAAKAKALQNIGKDRILVIVAAGPSILEVDFNSIKDHKLIDFMCINKPYDKIWPTKFWAFCDHTQYIRNERTWDSYQGIIINSTNVKARKDNQIIINARPGKGFSNNVTEGYYIGRSSTYAAMQLATYMNYKKIFIFGVDMSSEINGKLWWYGQNPDVANTNRKGRFTMEAESYLWAAKNLSKDLINKFTFCSNYNKHEFMKHFPKLDHKIAIQEIVNYINK